MTLRRAVGLRLGKIGGRLVVSGFRLSRLGWRVVDASNRLAPIRLAEGTRVEFFEGWELDVAPLFAHRVEVPIVWTPHGLADPGARSFSGTARLDEGSGCLVWDPPMERADDVDFVPPIELEFPHLWGPLDDDSREP